MTHYNIYIKGFLLQFFHATQQLRPWAEKGGSDTIFHYLDFILTRHDNADKLFANNRHSGGITTPNRDTHRLCVYVHTYLRMK